MIKQPKTCSVLRDNSHPTRATVESEHISTRKLASFCDERLEEDAARKVMRHLAGCDDCLQSFKDLHEALNPALIRPIGTRQLNSLLRAVGSRSDGKPELEPRRIGLILVERLKDKLKLTWEAATTAAQRQIQSHDTNSIQHFSKNSVLERPLEKMRSSPTLLRARSYVSSSSPPPEAPKAHWASFESRAQESRNSAPAWNEAIIRIDDAEFDLHVQVADPTLEGWPLTVWANRRFEPLPIENLHLTVEAGGRSERKATGVDGEARFILPAGSTKAALTLETGEMLDRSLIIDLVLLEK